MKVLLDTHTFLFAFDRPEALGARARAALLDPSIERYVSTISLWEIAIKVRIGKLQLPTHRSYYTAQLEFLNATILPVTLDHSLEIFQLPLHHRDPFDRLLIAQARAEDLTLVTRDRTMTAYGIPTLW